MNFNTYQKLAKRTDYRSKKEEERVFGNLLIHATLGLVGESGEFADKIKKIFRDRNGKLDRKLKHELMLELGDVLWYLATAARKLGLKLDDVAKANIAKLASRQKRGVIKGDGDHR